MKFDVKRADGKKSEQSKKKEGKAIYKMKRRYVRSIDEKQFISLRLDKTMVGGLRSTMDGTDERNYVLELEKGKRTEQG